MVDQKHVDAIIQKMETPTPDQGPASSFRYFYPKDKGWHSMSLEGASWVETLMSISKVRPKSSNYTLTENDFFVPVNASGGDVYIYLPASVTDPGRQYVVAKVDATANKVYVVPNGADTINGVSLKSIAVQWRSNWFANDGVSNWCTPSEYLGPTAFLRGKTTIVDGIYGSDATGAREDSTRPFQTIQAALAVSVSGDIVLVLPGTYSLPAAGLTIPSGVSLRGVCQSSCKIQLLNVTANTTLITMGDSSYLQDFELKLTSAQHHTLTGIKFSGTTNMTAEVDHVLLEVDNSGAGAGTSNVTGILVQCTGTPSREVNSVFASSVIVTSTGSGAKRALLVNSSACNFFVREANWVAHGGSDAIAIETNIAGCLFGAVTGVADGDLADVSRTLGNMELGQIDLIHSNANGKGFTATQISFSIVWADPGGIQNGIRFYRPGSAAVTATEIKLNVPRKCVVKKLHVRVLTAPGTGKSITWIVRKNGVDTGLTVTISDLNLIGSNDSVSVSFAANDDISLKVDAGVNSASDSVCVVETY